MTTGFTTILEVAVEAEDTFSKQWHGNGKSPINGGFDAKSPINGPFSIAMFDYQQQLKMNMLDKLISNLRAERRESEEETSAATVA